MLRRIHEIRQFSPVLDRHWTNILIVGLSQVESPCVRLSAVQKMLGEGRRNGMPSCGLREASACFDRSAISARFITTYLRLFYGIFTANEIKLNHRISV